ncbi:hypothetical protein O4215_16785 [Rhodococcus maanshanensis]|uniref:hypothetical protein n=1 Tax=Rhodococcus maanshanensis TaxID=183556 RepID=UPI0022B4F0AE|nr:hypothetical protein [Rhodococcus maanshanensis]MCZ4557228.1 hypothetical protein [Rhodococcus maanshanensis]
MLGIPMAVARFNYRFARLPFQLVEDIGATRLDEGAAVRLGYERMLIYCDRAAAYLLHDESAAMRARDLREQTNPARIALELEKRQAEQREQGEDVDEVQLLRGHRAKFLHRHQAYRGEMPPSS